METLSTDETFVRFRCKIGFHVDGVVLLEEDPEADDPERPALVSTLGPSHPDVQTERETAFDDEAQHYSTHARSWAGDELPQGYDLGHVDLDDVEEIEKDELWQDGRFVRRGIDDVE